MKLQLTDKQEELLTQTFNDYVESGVYNRIEVVNTYWNVIEGISVMMEMDSITDTSVVLDDRYSLGPNSLTKKIKEKEFSQ